MHEAALAQELVDLIERVALENRATTVTRATVEVGELSGVVAEALSFAFEVARQNTVAATCELALLSSPLIVSCPACGFRGNATRGIIGCPTCDAVPLEVVAGRDMRLVSIDVEDEQNA